MKSLNCGKREEQEESTYASTWSCRHRGCWRSAAGWTSGSASAPGPPTGTPPTAPRPPTPAAGPAPPRPPSPRGTSATSHAGSVRIQNHSRCAMCVQYGAGRGRPRRSCIAWCGPPCPTRRRRAARVRRGARRAGAGATRPAGGTPSLSLPSAPLLSRPLCLLAPMNRAEHGSVFRFLSCEGGRSFGVGHLGCQAVYLSLLGKCNVAERVWGHLLGLAQATIVSTNSY
jgi:hypothetical protein